MSPPSNLYLVLVYLFVCRCILLEALFEQQHYLYLMSVALGREDEGI